MATIKAIVMPTVAPQAKFPFVNDKGNLSSHAQHFIQQHYNQTAGMNRLIPCNSSAVGNVHVLTISAPMQFVYQGYATHDTFSFVAAANSTDLVTAKVVTPTGALATLPVYITHGSAQATTGNITAGLQYMLSYVDSLNGGVGGFVLR